MNYQLDSDKPSDLPFGINPLNSIADTQRLTGRSRGSVYQMLAAGELEAVKDGRRILVTGASIVARMGRLPRAVIGGGKQAAA